MLAAVNEADGVIPYDSDDDAVAVMLADDVILGVEVPLAVDVVLPVTDALGVEDGAKGTPSTARYWLPLAAVASMV